MSQENVDRFVKGIEAYNHNDIPGVLRFMDPEIHFEHRLAELQGDFVGLDAVRGWFAELEEYFEDGQIHCSDVRDLGDRVLGLGTVRSIGKGWSSSTIDSDRREAQPGKSRTATGSSSRSTTEPSCRSWGYPNPEEALADIGLAE